MEKSSESLHVKIEQYVRKLIFDGTTKVGDLIPRGTPFDAYLPLNGSWGGSFSGLLAIPNATAAAAAPTVLNGFVHGA